MKVTGHAQKVVLGVSRCVLQTPAIQTIQICGFLYRAFEVSTTIDSILD
jgi:hypothetical protein